MDSLGSLFAVDPHSHDKDLQYHHLCFVKPELCTDMVHLLVTLSESCDLYLGSY